LKLEMNSINLISGGQTGVDRAVLDFALCNNIICSGWCPNGRLAEDGFIPRYYPLKESYSTEYRVRTEQNVMDSDGTLIIIYEEMDQGTMLSHDFTLVHSKPVFVWKLPLNRNYYQFVTWLTRNRIRKLNIAGPRLSNAPGIYEATLDLLDILLEGYKR